MTEQEEPRDDGAPAAHRGGHLRLVWSNPAPRPLPKKPTDLAAAIEQQLSGEFGLSDDDFARVFARAACGGGPAPVRFRVL